MRCGKTRKSHQPQVTMTSAAELCEKRIKFTEPVTHSIVGRQEQGIVMNHKLKLSLLIVFVSIGVQQVWRVDVGLNLSDEQSELKLPEEMLREAKVKWHSFKLEGIREQADEAFLKSTKVKNGLRKKLTSD
jgi:hypothetical protein